MTTRGQAALLCLGLCYVSSFSFAAATDLPIDTALSSINLPANSQAQIPDTPSADYNDLSLQASPSTQEDSQILWPMMPQESLAQLAQTFYPNSPILAQRFIQKSIRLSRSLGIFITPDVPFQHAQVIAIPNEKEVRALTHRIKKREELQAAQEQLQLSYQLKGPSAVNTKSLKSGEHAVKSTLINGPISLELPKLSVPKIEMPRLNTPNLGSISDNVKNAGQHVGAQMQSAWHTTKTALMDWQAYAFGKTDQLSQKRVTKMLANQNTRIALFLGGLVVLAWLLWRLQKRYLQRKVVLLNNIESTLIEPEFTEPTIGEITITEHNESRAEHSAMFNTDLEISSDIQDSELKAPAFQDTATLVEQLSVDTQRIEDVTANNKASRSKRNR